MGKLIGWMLLGINALVALLLVLSAYSPYINPQVHAMWSGAGLLFPFLLLGNVLFLIFWLIFYRKYALLPLLVLLGCWGAIRNYIPVNLFREEVPEEAIKILSYNTHSFGGRQKHTVEKPNEVLAYLQECDADIICLQEYVWGGKLKRKDIDYAMRKYKYKHYNPMTSTGRNGLGCYSRYPILSAKRINYKSRGNGSMMYRIKVGEDTLVVINNHLESNKIAEADRDTYQELLDNPYQETTLPGMGKLIKKVADASVIRSIQADSLNGVINALEGEKIIVCGDFNDSPISYTYRVMSEGLTDAFVESGNGLGISYNLDRFYFRIDHILMSDNLQPYHCTVDRSVKASDHYPIWCHVGVK